MMPQPPSPVAAPASAVSNASIHMKIPHCHLPLEQHQHQLFLTILIHKCHTDAQVWCLSHFPLEQHQQQQLKQLLPCRHP
ncbi:hypothetical protein DUNSADRAFT_4941 [Dunaliella salina]|uniref:Encoded protein n=1 Tax=Dunaliella salina TaxID=3046 RepID=A0ABQ7FVE7_DUNSA|nr:hypothetical protein DUNSADRAFT_4941 [Dunaliella salina]|eukprot:KAF5826077.1 hypothetical protein DUNSADRAFT_4941 [Dunaliella salina]